MKQNIIKPVITEKTLTLAGRGWYTFAVLKHTTKPIAAREIAKLYKVTVTAVRSLISSGKSRRVGRKSLTTARPDRKKVLVRLGKDQTIDAFTVGSQDTGSEKSKI